MSININDKGDNLKDSDIIEMRKSVLEYIGEQDGKQDLNRAIKDDRKDDKKIRI